MGRPSKESGLAPAEDRLVAAFWELFPQVPLGELTVQRVTSCAGLNRSTFYRCFASLDDLVRTVEDDVIPLHVPTVVVRGLAEGDLVDRLHAVARSQEQNFDRLCLLLSSKGDPTFARRVKDAMVGEWVRALGGDVEALDGPTRAALEFLVSGATGTFAYRGDVGLEVDTLALVESWAPMVAPPVVSALRARIEGSGTAPA